jgi:CBS domain-containing protein
MIAVDKSLFDLTAEDLMSRHVVRLASDLPLQTAAQLLIRNQISGAPVVDGRGRCVGVLSAADFVRLAQEHGAEKRPPGPARAVTCSFQEKLREIDGRVTTLCTLARGLCPIQSRRLDADGRELNVCTEPHCAMVDWQVVGVEELPSDEVRWFMTADPVTAGPATPIRTLARMMVDAHVHRVIVVDADRKPVGVVASTDVLAVLAQGPEVD